MAKSLYKNGLAENSPLTAPDEWLQRYQPPRSVKGDSVDFQPYLSILNVFVYVRDQDESLKFYIERLGFQLVADSSKEGEGRWVAVAPPDGSVVLALIKPREGSPESTRIGSFTGVTLGSEDIAAQFREWSDRGVRFNRTPTPMSWGILANFQDLDGNEFALIQSPWLIDLLNAHRRAEEERKEAERRRLKQLNEMLEERVRTRTRELEQANRDLREMQAQLVQSGKMASLGMLAAGIAHEINNPVGAIHSNADVARRTVDTIRGMLQDPEFAQKPGYPSRLNHAFQILDKVNRATLEATDRVTKVVQSLKSFARLDQAEVELMDLHKGLESTLTLIDHLVRDRIEVIKNYGKLPMIKCYASQINQVFANVLANAAQAIETTGSITITTSQEGPWVLIRVADTGVGISPEHLNHIFDPGFTTKGVRVGIGLGLSIAYRIIENHHGSIDVESEPGKGTTFTIRLPVTR